MNKKSLLTLAPIVALLNFGCAKKEASPVMETSKTPDSGHFLYVSENEERTDPADSKSEVSISRRHRAILNMNGLISNSTYEIKWRLVDPKGKEWPLRAPKITFTSGGTSWNAWSTFFPPDEPAPPGVWRWEATLLNGPTVRREFNMVPPSHDEMAQIARYEKCRETAFRAFAHRWLGHDGYYFGTVSNGLAQIANVKYNFKMDYISTADAMNGITYKGRVAFTFSAFRVFGWDGNWIDWEDTTEYESSFSAFMGETFAGNLPARYQRGFDMNFTLQERDGHWRVWSDTGAFYLNNRVVKSTLAAQPSTAQVVQALSGSSSRKTAASQGDSVRQYPAPSEADILKTVDSLRGRRL